MNHDKFDYVIVGAGSAGCVLAHRLSANPDCRVLLLESGGEDDADAIHTPACYSELQDSAYDWALRTVPQQHLCGRRIFLPQGHVLGGSSSINYMIYMRGNAGDYNHWQNLGNPGWSYQEVLPYFIKAENNQTLSNEFHGNSGPLIVSSHHSENALVQRYFAAAQEAGLAFNPDFNGQSQEGFGPMQATITQGRRCSTATAYLGPARGRINLTVLTHALTTRILFSENRAVGVEYVQLGQTTKAYANEVILATGALRSPQLLMLSGIGPQHVLCTHQLEVRNHLPGVGNNLQDHLHTRVRCEINQPLTYPALSTETKHALKNAYNQHHDGLLASNMLEAGAFIKTSADESMPDLQLFFLMALPPDYPEGGASYGHGLTFTAYINRPHSRGSIRLASPNPLQKPIIDFNYLSEPEDMICALEGVRWNLKILYAKAFDDIRTTEIAPGKHIRNVEGLKAFIRRTASTTWHPCGTCKMGNDEMSVVDAQLRVHGIKQLRVVDASIMPTIVSGNTNAPTIMIAEKAADMILSDA